MTDMVRAGERTRRLTLTLLVGVAAGCGTQDSRIDGAPGTSDSTVAPADSGGPPVVDAEAWLSTPFLSPGTTPEEVRSRFGSPDSRTAEPTPNRHIPDQTDSIVTLTYDRGLAVTFYAITGGDELLQEVVISEPGILGPPVDVGMEWSEITGILGEPDGRRSGMPYFTCPTCGEAEEPVAFAVTDGVVRRIRFSYYVD